MKRLALIVLLTFLPLLAHAQVARYAVVAGNNRGVERAAALKYAERDAERFAEVLVEVGGFAQERVALVTGGSVAQFRAALAQLEARIRADTAGARAMVVLYFSGHADGINLEFGAEAFPFAELRRWVEAVPGGVKIAFVDSCLSGAITQVKGGALGPSFDITVSDTLDANGTAIVTSSARGEHSQESQELGGSFFTTYLISGFRGAADLNGDGRITLAEVYQYAFGRTVAGTAKTVAGVQHPTYDFKIAGKGDVVLAQVSQGSCALLLGPECAGSFLVVDAARGEVVAEVSKPEGVHRRLALRPGAYTVTHQRGGGWFTQKVAVAAGETAEIDPSTMVEERGVAAVTKGNSRRRSGVEMMLGYGFSGGILSSVGAASQGIMGVRLNAGPLAIVPRFAYSQTKVDDETMRMHYFMHMFSIESYVAWRFDLAFLDLFAGVNVGGGYNRQKYADQKEYDATAFIYGPMAGIDVPIGAGFSVQTFFQYDLYVLNVNKRLTQNGAPRGTFGIGYEF